MCMSIRAPYLRNLLELGSTLAALPLDVHSYAAALCQPQIARGRPGMAGDETRAAAAGLGGHGHGHPHMGEGSHQGMMPMNSYDGMGGAMGHAGFGNSMGGHAHHHHHQSMMTPGPMSAGAVS